MMAFSVCVLGGLSAGARAEVAIVRGLKAMVAFCLLGWVVGWAAETVVYERVRKEAQEEAAKTPPAREAAAGEDAKPAGS